MVRNLLAALIGLLGTTSLQAHHSFVSQYDVETVTEVAGTVTEVWYQNPHSRVYFETTNEQGAKELWEAETYPRNILNRRGWKHDDLRVGDEVVVTGRRAKDGSNRLQIFTIVRPSDGWEGVGYEADSID